MQRSFGQLFTTLREMRNYPMTLTFLLAYLFYNDGIQTVIYAASTYGEKQLGFDQDVLIATILLIQFVAFGGALLLRPAGRQVRRLPLDPVGHLRLDGDRGASRCSCRRRTSRCSSPLAVAIGIVLGGTQALSRSFFSLLIPRGREGEYFSLYNAAERGTSWFGTLLFGVVFQVTGSYRPAIFALIIFFVLGAFFLLRLDPERGIRGGGQPRSRRSLDRRRRCEPPRAGNPSRRYVRWKHVMRAAELARVRASRSELVRPSVMTGLPYRLMGGTHEE